MSKPDPQSPYPVILASLTAIFCAVLAPALLNTHNAWWRAVLIVLVVIYAATMGALLSTLRSKDKQR